MGNDHAVEQRAHGVEAAHVQACGGAKNTDEQKENKKQGEKKSLNQE